MQDLSTVLQMYKLSLYSENGFSANTINSYISDVKIFMESNNFSYTEVVTQDVLNYLSELYKLELCPSTISRKRSSLLSFYSYLENSGFDIKVDFEKIPSVKHNYHLPDILSQEEMLDFLDKYPMNNPQNIRNKTILEVLYSTGMRISE